ncbi:hypothetical protein LMG9673_03456 [Ralstonia pseudosolanacearum]|nr:hypothetical protein LMG9673_03456 [Ralstonia pseudosolanacearum]
MRGCPRLGHVDQPGLLRERCTLCQCRAFHGRRDFDPGRAQDDGRAIGNGWCVGPCVRADSRCGRYRTWAQDADCDWCHSCASGGRRRGNGRTGGPRVRHKEYPRDAAAGSAPILARLPGGGSVATHTGTQRTVDFRQLHSRAVKIRDGAPFDQSSTPAPSPAQVMPQTKTAAGGGRWRLGAWHLSGEGEQPSHVSQARTNQVLSRCESENACACVFVSRYLFAKTQAYDGVSAGEQRSPRAVVAKAEIRLLR